MSTTSSGDGKVTASQAELLIEQLLFASRWIQVPMYLGLTVASILYAVRFMLDLVNLLPLVLTASSSEPLLLAVLGLVDMTLVANLVTMIVIGGYSLFVGKMNINNEEDRPEWLDKTTAATLKIKLASALVGVSGIHLLKTFIELGGEVDLSMLHHGGHEIAEAAQHQAAHAIDNMKVMWQIIIHAVFLLSALVLSWSERILHPSDEAGH